MTDLVGLKCARDLVGSLFVFAKAVQMHGPHHPAVVSQGEALAAAIAAAAPPLTLQFVAGGVFRDRSLLPLDAESYRRAEYVSALLTNLQRQEITFEGVPSALAISQLADVLGQASQVSSALEDLEIPGLRFREIPNARFGLENEQVDVETFVAAQLTLALESAESALAGTQTWAWDRGLAAVRRVERAVEVGAAAALRVIDEMPGQWTAGRFAVSASLSVCTALKAVGATSSSRRAATHTGLLLARVGFRAGSSGASLGQASDDALRAALAAPIPVAVDPHRLRTCALLQLNAALGASPEGLSGLLGLSYRLEQLRVRPGVPFSLTRQDLLAEAVRHLDKPYPSLWVRLLVAAHGAVPAGSTVRLADGRLARVLGPGPTGDVLRPEVLVDGLRLVPPSRVTLVPAGSLR